MKAKITKRNKHAVLLFAVLLAAAFALAASVPEGPEGLSVVNSSRRQLTPASTLDAIAGNVTQLNIYAQTQTLTWQGYYGNVTGTINLGDASGYILYDWETANPSGQVYASTSELSFSSGNIECYNFSKREDNYLNLTDYEASLGLSPGSADGINETFNETTLYDPFYVGANYINKTCPVVYLYNSSNASSAGTYQEVMLYEKTANDVIYTSIIRPGGIIGFNNLPWDFQMIVAEDGHSGNTAPTTYYFYVALQ
ncbi:hypothetical protein GF323_04695 [Candidatus Woesearchaeota archaeon]|nr:hypothetical protein [Candidatus Woesearchaeota archaeon]